MQNPHKLLLCARLKNNKKQTLVLCTKIGFLESALPSQKLMLIIEPKCIHTCVAAVPSYTLGIDKYIIFIMHSCLNFGLILYTYNILY